MAIWILCGFFLLVACCSHRFFFPPISTEIRCMDVVCLVFFLLFLLKCVVFNYACCVSQCRAGWKWVRVCIPRCCKSPHRRWAFLWRNATSLRLRLTRYALVTGIDSFLLRFSPRLNLVLLFCLLFFFIYYLFIYLFIYFLFHFYFYFIFIFYFFE
jgi:hypothetical protein